MTISWLTQPTLIIPRALLQDDLSRYHILFDPAASQLSAILNFGVAGEDDPANDLALLINYSGLSLSAASKRSIQAWVLS